jgi:hypothetical protein
MDKRLMNVSMNTRWKNFCFAMRFALSSHEVLLSCQPRQHKAGYSVREIKTAAFYVMRAFPKTPTVFARDTKIS